MVGPHCVDLIQQFLIFNVQFFNQNPNDEIRIWKRSAISCLVNYNIYLANGKLFYFILGRPKAYKDLGVATTKGAEDANEEEEFYLRILRIPDVYRDRFHGWKCF